LLGIFFCLLRSERNIAKEMRGIERERKKLSRLFLLFSFLNNKLNLFLVMEIAY